LTVKITVIGQEEAVKILNKSNKKIMSDVSEGLKKAGFFVQGEVKLSIAGQRAELTSVDTGRFLNSVDVAATKDDAVVYTEIEYAKFLEYGTSKFRPRAHFRNSASRSKEKVKELIKEEIKI